MSHTLFRCSGIPVMQNRVHDSIEAARQAPIGDMDIQLHEDFGVNTRFDVDLLQYDEQYDNAVPSPLFMQYYDRLADWLATRYDLSRGPVVEVGCGHGTFLKRLAERHAIEGIGFDPSYVGAQRVGNLTFIADRFDARYIDGPPSLLLSRHTFEHIPDPHAVLRDILDTLPRHTPIPVFIEVPDLQWILESRSWWDLAYEHVNYFTSPSLHRLLAHVGCGDIEVHREFGDQYLWGCGVLGRDVEEGIPATRAFAPVDFTSLVESSLQRAAADAGDRTLVIWGMAAKGVLYAFHAQRAGLAIASGVDINPDKQGRFAPVSGLHIAAPEDLPQDQRYAVLCMNPQYQEEIGAHCQALGLDHIPLAP